MSHARSPMLLHALNRDNVSGFRAQVPLRDPSGSTRIVELVCSSERRREDGRERRRCRMSLATPDVSAEGVGYDYFDAFCRLREQLNAADYWLVCYGANANFAFSGMARDMSDGLTGYVYHARGAAQIANVLATGPGVRPVTVAEQSDFRQRAWLKDTLLRSPPAP